jgi:hypothetical protein
MTSVITSHNLVSVDDVSTINTSLLQISGTQKLQYYIASLVFIASPTEISNFTTKMSGAPLNIIVIGAGIAGLGAAITLSRAGHTVTVGWQIILTPFDGGADAE